MKINIGQTPFTERYRNIQPIGNNNRYREQLEMARVYRFTYRKRLIKVNKNFQDYRTAKDRGFGKRSTLLREGKTKKALGNLTNKILYQKVKTMTMKKLSFLFIVLLTGCSSVSLVENWKNPDIVIFDANKVLIVGMVQNQDARESFEGKLQKVFDKRGVEAMRSLDVFDINFTDSRKSEKELDEVEQSLLDKDFDAILFTKITGSEDRESFLKTISRWDNYQGRFKEDYRKHQDIYYDEGYYDKFTVYHAETTLYCICEGKDRAMIWRGSIDITDPKDIEKSINDYIKLVVLAMEEQDLIFSKESNDEITGL